MAKTTAHSFALTDGPLSTSLGRIAPLFDQARAAGLDIGDELAALGAAPDLDRQSSQSRLSLADYYRIQHHFAQRLGDETVNLSPRHLSLGSTDLVLANIEGCENLLEAMQAIARSYNLLHGGQYNFIERKRDTIDYVVDDRAFPYTMSDNDDYIFFVMECVLIFFHCMLLLIAPDHASFAVRRLSIRRARGVGQLRHLSYWRAPIRFGAERYRIQFNREWVLKPFTAPPPHLTSNALYLKIVEAVSDRGSDTHTTQTTAAAVRSALSTGIVEQTQIALQLGVSVATLRRRLSEEGESFRQLRRDALNDAAKHLLSSGRSVEEAANELGFSECRSFNRAFRDWNGVTPKRFQTDATTAVARKPE
ncbi:MAG: helix-turn-helix domain-containing protein [Pseudomonadota bacterium]